MINGYEQYLNKAALTPGLEKNFFERSIGLGKFVRSLDYLRKMCKEI